MTPEERPTRNPAADSKNPVTRQVVGRISDVAFATALLADIIRLFGLDPTGAMNHDRMQGRITSESRDLLHSHA